MLALPDDAAQVFGRKPLKAEHRLHELPLFGDDALAELLDRMPRSHLFALTMGDDPERAADRRPAAHEGVSGAGLLEAVRRGKLWLNVTRVDTYEPRYAELLDALFADLARKVPGLRIDGRRATLLISSPSAQVYYHADGAPTVLWHLRGRKRLYVYPADDERFLSRHDLEDIFAGVRTEYVPYRRELDADAVALDLSPGEYAAWPQNAPHRVVNLEGLNVSLSSEYFTPESRRKARVYVANRFLRTTLRIERTSADERLVFAAPKIAVHRVGEALGLAERNTRRHVPVVRIDPAAPLGVVPLAPPLAVRSFADVEALRPFASALDALNRASARPDPFATFGFFERYLAHHRDVEPRFLVAFEGESPRGLLALRRRTDPLLGTRLEFLAERDVDAPGIVCGEGDEERCGAAFYRFLLADREWSLLELRQQYDGSALLQLPRDGDAPRHRLRLLPGKENATIPVGRFGSLAAFHRACSKKHRNNVSRAVRALLAAGKVEHVSSDDPAALPALLELYATIEPRSWKGGGRAAFLRSLLTADAPLRLAIDLLLLDGVPVAGLINGAAGDTLYALQIAHDEAFAALSPGTAILLFGVRRAIEGGFRAYNLLSGFGYYKSRWLAELQPSHTVQVLRMHSAYELKARLGELKRAVFPPAPDAPSRRDTRVGERLEPARIAPLLAAVPRDRTVWLDATALRRILPFETSEARAAAP